MNTDEKLALLTRFAAAWNAHDADEVVACMTPDCTYYSAVGSGPQGALVAGRTEVRAACEHLWANIPNATWHISEHVVSGNRGYSSWLFTGSTVSGDEVKTNGVDLFSFEGKLIAKKDTYRKALQQV